MSMYDANVAMIFKLLQISLGVKKNPLDLQDINWNYIYSFAERHSLVGILFSGIERLPKDMLPEIDLLVNWYGQSEHIKSINIKQKQSSQNLFRIAKNQGCDFCIMKGLAISLLYPNPEYRGYGDIDIFIYGNYQIFEKSIKDCGIKIVTGPKHDEFAFEGVHVELHKYYINNSSRVGKTLNQYLNKVSRIELCSRSECGWAIPNFNFNVVFLLRHMCVHLATEGMTLRNVLDYALLLLKEGEKINWDEVISVLKKTKMDCAFDTMVGVAEKVLDVDFSIYYIGKPVQRLIDRVLDEVMNVNLHAESRYPLFKRIIIKTKRLFSHKWMYDSGLLPDSFWTEVVWGSIKDHIKRPKLI